MFHVDFLHFPDKDIYKFPVNGNLGPGMFPWIETQLVITMFTPWNMQAQHVYMEGIFQETL